MKYELRYKWWINVVIMILSVPHCLCWLFYFQNITFLFEKLSCAAEILIWSDAVDFLTKSLGMPYSVITAQQACSSPRNKHWPGALFRPPGQYILYFTGPYGQPRYMSGHQISNSAGPNDDKSHYVLFARPTSRQFSRSPFATARDTSVTRVGVGHVNQTHWRQCLDHVARDTSMRTSGTHPGTFLREAHGMVASKQFCVWWVVWPNARRFLVGQSEILIDKSAGSMQLIVVTNLTVILSVIRVIVRLSQWK